ncbi:MAG: hypothetical protein HY044_00965 [Candidatus Woesebacteria bacterium]|nr:MAG: hypothetical protein HY044_00965 [Candidatus Woesebacteria bacterium]
MNNLLAQATKIPEVPLQVGQNTTVSIPSLKGFETLFANVLQVAIALAGIGFFVMLLIGGFKYLTSGGDPKAVESAKNTLTWAIFGLVAVALAFLILLAIANFTGVTSILNFQVAP